MTPCLIMQSRINMSFLSVILANKPAETNGYEGHAAYTAARQIAELSDCENTPLDTL